MPPKDSPVVLNEPFPSFQDPHSIQDVPHHELNTATVSKEEMKDEQRQMEQTSCEWNDTMVYRDDKSKVTQPLDIMEASSSHGGYGYHEHHRRSDSEWERMQQYGMMMRPPRRNYDDLPPHV